MTIRLGWIEEVLQWVQTETNTMAIKLRDTHLPENYRGDVAVGLVNEKKHFFKELENLQKNLEAVSELASDLVCITDLCGTDDSDEDIKGDM